MNILHLAPHPDDECIAAPATLLALLDAGHSVTNLAVSLGRGPDQIRRHAEVTEACSRMGISLHVADPLLSISSSDDMTIAEDGLVRQITELAAAGPIDLIIAPSHHDAHHGHEVVGRAAIRAAQELGAPLWMWGLWADLPLPNIMHAFSEELMERSEQALQAHAGENDRNNYLALLRHRAKANVILGAERVFGFGSVGIDADYAEALCEVIPDGERWMYGTARMFDASEPLAKAFDVDATPFVQARSIRETLREHWKK